MTDQLMIDVDNIHFTYPDGRQVLKGLTCQIRRGEKVALIGHNGAGKSTFMSHLNGVELANSGTVTIQGVEINKKTLKDVRRSIGIVFQDPDDQLFCPTVFDDVAFGPLNLGLPKEEIVARVKDSLHIVGLDDFEERSSFHLSFGERKRLALATVLSYQPEILVFDEPSTNMDPLNRRKLINWLKESDKTILLCTHDLDIALEVCDRVLMLDEGVITVDGPASEVLYNRELLEKNKLELPLALMTHEMLHGVLYTEDMDEEHREIISKFLHSHRHSHGPGGHEHFHIHGHRHDHGHLHGDASDEHTHDSDHHNHDGEGHGHNDVPHSHEDGHQHDHGDEHSHDDGHTHTHDEEK